jgi:2,4-dienoyl-CoA reductase-like NADH-dependent reductase (Old Yellow Enzyme family)
MAPMTRSHSPGAIPGPDVAAYYRRRAENGVGLILTEGTAPDHPAAVNDINVPNFHGDEALAGWARVVSEVHAAGGRIMPQFWHVGMMRKPGDGPNPEVPPVGPSGLNLEGQKVVEPITEAEIQRVIEGYARSAGHAKRLGFDGLEIHAAHGYLIDQFFWDQTNRRTDKYGGSVANRARFGAEVVRACRQAAGPDFPILLRFSQWKIAHFDAKIARTPEELAELLEPLAEAGVDVFHCSQRRFWEPEFEGSPLNLAGWTKKLAGKPTITVGSVGLDADFIATFSGEATAANAQLDRLIEMVETGEADLVAVGRALLSDPAWASKVRDGRIDELAAFNPEALKVLI